GRDPELCLRARPRGVRPGLPRSTLERGPIRRPVSKSPRSPSIVSRPSSLGAIVLTGVISFAPMAVAELLAKFPRERTWLLPALQAVQRAERYLSPEALEAVAAHLRVPKSEVWGVASHYPELRLAPPGTRVVRVRTGVSCKLRGGGELLAACERRLGLRAGQTTADGAVTLAAMDCAFACAVAPVVETAHACHGRVTPRALDALLAARPAAHAAAATPGVAPPPRPTTGSPVARFATLRREAERRRTGARLAVGMGTCAHAVGARETFEALRLEV